MANAAIAYVNLADLGALTASASEPLMPVTRLQNEHVSKRWRNLNVLNTVAYVVCDLGSLQSIDTIALLGMTVSALALMRVRVSTDDTDNTKILLHFAGSDGSTTVSDSAVSEGASAHTWTAVGNAQLDTADKKWGSASLLLDGTGDWITTPDSAEYALGSGNFTVECWFKCNVATGAARAIAGQADAVPTAATGSFYLRRESAGQMRFALSTGAGFTSVTSTSTFSDSVNTGWHHIAVVRVGNILRMFIDGVQEGGDVAFTGAVPDSNQLFVVGQRGGGGDPWQGWIDEFRLTVGTAIYTTNFTVPNGAFGNPGERGNLLDAYYDTNTAYFDERYGALIVPLAAPVSARFVRIDISDYLESYIEAGRLFIGLRESFTYNFAPGASRTWIDRSRKTKSSGGQTLIWPDNKYRVVDLNFEWISEVQREGLVESIDLANGQSVDVLLILDTASDNIPRDSIFGLVSEPGAVMYTTIGDLFARSFKFEERL